MSLRFLSLRGEEATKFRKKTVDPRNNCKTKNVVYGLFCEVCKSIVYVGETERTVGEKNEGAFGRYQA